MKGVSQMDADFQDVWEVVLTWLQEQLKCSGSCKWSNVTTVQKSRIMSNSSAVHLSPADLIRE
jgi:hypothetical protein